MGVAVNIISAVLKSVVGDKIGNELTNEVIGISIDGVSEKGIDRISDFINGEKAKIENIISKENMKSIGISEESIDYVVAEIKDLLLKVEITDEVLRQCKYDSMNLSIFLWTEYCKQKNSHIECESDIKKGLLAVSKALVKLMRESEAFEKEVLIHISNSVDDANVGLQKISEYMKGNFGKLDDNDHRVLNILLMILEQIQERNMQDNESKRNADEDRKFQNNKKQEYIKNWNSRMFLHVSNEENPITLEEAFIMPDYEIHKSMEGIGLFKKEPLEQVIERFVGYNKTSTMLITGVPGIGKSTITSWIANKYKDNGNVVVLRFRDWKKLILEKTLLEVVCNKLACEEDDLENKILILDGYDEMKALHIRERFLNEFFNDIKDFENFKCIITSRPAYIDTNRFSYVIALKGFDLSRIEDFYRRITKSKLEEKGKIKSNLEVLGIPVILYMAIMSKVDISKNPTKPELYNRIFAEKGGIFDKFNDGKVEYGKGNQILRNPDNIKKYLKFLQDTAFMMFETNDHSLSSKDCTIPELEFGRKMVTIVDFPIKHLFEKADTIEFIHNSIYEYFVADYIFVSICKGADLSTEEFAGIFGNLLKRNRLSPEILEFLKYKVGIGELNNKFAAVKDTFELMLADGMTYHTGRYYKNVIDCETMVFANMLDIIHLWEWDFLRVDPLIGYYLAYNWNLGLNLSKLDFSRAKAWDFSGVFLVKANLRGVNLENGNLRRVDLREADLSKINLKGADLSGADLRDVNLREADLRGADLRGASLNRADLRSADLEGVYLRGANLYNTYLKGANLKKTYFRGADLCKAYLVEAELDEISMEGTVLESAIFDEKQIKYLEKIYDLSRIMVCFDNVAELISYDEYCDRKKKQV